MPVFPERCRRRENCDYECLFARHPDLTFCRVYAIISAYKIKGESLDSPLFLTQIPPGKGGGCVFVAAGAKTAGSFPIIYIADVRFSVCGGKAREPDGSAFPGRSGIIAESKTSRRKVL